MASVSVIIPTYNYGPYIRQAIDSLLAQTRVPDQIIVVNDGSTDDTARVVGQVRDPRLVYVEQENSGVSVTRNHGLSLATGDFIGFLDADDRWRPTMLEKQLAILHGDPSIACSFTNFERFDEGTGRGLGEQFRQYPELSSLPTMPGAIAHSHVLTGDAFCEFVAFGDIPAFTQVMLFRARLIDGLRFNDHLELGEDTEFALQAFMKGRVAYTSEVLADVRRHGTNATTDHHWMPVHKLNALKAIGDVVGPGRHRVAYCDRLVKAHIDAAVEQVRRGHIRTGISTYAEGLSVRGSLRRKVRGGARLAVTFLGGGGSAVCTAVYWGGSLT